MLPGSKGCRSDHPAIGGRRPIPAGITVGYRGGPAGEGIYMSIMDVHLRDLRYFVAVAEELNFTRAAERLYVSQPALSKQIRQLEQAMRATLLRRDPRGVTLTAAGALLLPSARRLLATSAGTARAGPAAGTPDRRVLRPGLQTTTRRNPHPAPPPRFAQGKPALRPTLP